MRHTDFFTQYMRPYKLTKPLLKNSINSRSISLTQIFLIFDLFDGPILFFLKCRFKVLKSSSKSHDFCSPRLSVDRTVVKILNNIIAII